MRLPGQGARHSQLLQTIKLGTHKPQTSKSQINNMPRCYWGWLEWCWIPEQYPVTKQNRLLQSQCKSVSLIVRMLSPVWLALHPRHPPITNMAPTICSLVSAPLPSATIVGHRNMVQCPVSWGTFRHLLTSSSSAFCQEYWSFADRTDACCPRWWQFGYGMKRFTTTEHWISAPSQAPWHALRWWCGEVSGHRASVTSMEAAAVL